MRLSQCRVKWLRLRLKVLWLWLLGLLLLSERTVRGLLIYIDSRERMLGERLVDLSVDQMRGVQRLLLLLNGIWTGGD